MTTTFFISETKLRQFTDLNNNVDTELLRNAVREAQDIEIQRLIGTILYNKLISDVDGGTLTGDYKTLMDDYIQNALLYYAYYYALEDVYIRPRNNGLLTPQGGENSASVDASFYNRKRQSQKNKAEWYAEKLTEYLIENQAQFPEITQGTKLYEDIADFGIQYKSPIVFEFNTYAPNLRNAMALGIPITDSRYNFLPPPHLSKTKNVK